MIVNNYNFNTESLGETLDNFTDHFKTYAQK